MKKSLRILTVLSLLTIVSGCGNTEGSSSNSNNLESNPSVTENKSEAASQNVSEATSENNEIVFDTTKNVDITFYHTMNGTLMEVLQAAIDSFNEIYPNINVSSVSAGGYDDVRDQLKTAISASGALCDMVYCYPDHVALYNQANSVVVLDKYINDPVYGMTEEQLDDFIPSYLEEGRCFGDNLLYSLPFSKSSEVMFYDVDFFNEHDLSVPTHWFNEGEDDTTSMEFVCQKILEIDPNCYPLGYDSESNWFITMCEQLQTPYTSSESNHYLFDCEENRDFVKKLKVWYDKKYFTTKAIYGQYTSKLFTNNETDKPRCYMCIGSSAGASNQAPEGFVFEVGVAKVPQMDQANGKVISQGPNVCIFKNADKQKEIASWLLLRYLTTNLDFQANFSMISGYSPVIKSVYRNAVYQEFLDDADGGENITAASTAVARDQEDWYFTSPAFVGSSDARDTVGNLLVKVLTKTDPDIDKVVSDAFKDALNELNSK